MYVYIYIQYHATVGLTDVVCDLWAVEIIQYLWGAEMFHLNIFRAFKLLRQKRYQRYEKISKASPTGNSS